MYVHVSLRLLRASHTERMTAQCLHAALSEGLPSDSLGRFAEELYMNEVHNHMLRVRDHIVLAHRGCSHLS